MLAMDPTPVADNEKTPLFRDTRPGKNGKPMTYGSMMAVVKVLLMRAGMSVEDAGCHSYRRGTATALAHINAPTWLTPLRSLTALFMISCGGYVGTPMSSHSPITGMTWRKVVQ